jgi:hypothetical protein
MPGVDGAQVIYPVWSRPLPSNHCRDRQLTCWDSEPWQARIPGHLHSTKNLDEDSRCVSNPDETVAAFSIFRIMYDAVHELQHTRAHEIRAVVLIYIYLYRFLIERRS